MCHCEITPEFDLTELVTDVKQVHDKLIFKFGPITQSESRGASSRGSVRKELKTYNYGKLPDQRYEEYVKVLNEKNGVVRVLSPRVQEFKSTPCLQQNFTKN